MHERTGAPRKEAIAVEGIPGDLEETPRLGLELAPLDRERARFGLRPAHVRPNLSLLLGDDHHGARIARELSFVKLLAKGAGLYVANLGGHVDRITGRDTV